MTARLLRIARAAVAQGLDADLPTWTDSVLAKFKAATAVAPVEPRASRRGARDCAARGGGNQGGGSGNRGGGGCETLAAAEETLAAEGTTDEDKAAAEERKAAAEAAKAAADGARDAAMAEAVRREKAARTLTRKLPPMFARRNAKLAARPAIASNSPWHAEVHTTLGLVKHERAEDTVRVEGLPNVPEEAATTKRRSPSPPPPPTPTTPTPSPRPTPMRRVSPPPPPPPPALDAMRSFARGVELASRVGAHGRLMNAARAMHTLARSPSCGLNADRRLAKSGGAGLLAVAAARLVEHLEKLRVGTVDESPIVAVDGGATRAPVDDEGDRLREERRARIVEAQPPRERDPPPPWFAHRPGVAPEFCLRFVVTAAEACAAAGMNHRAIDLAVGIAEVLGTADAAAAAAMPIAVAAARDVAESLPEGKLEGLEKSARARGARPKPVAALADARAPRVHRRRRVREKGPGDPDASPRHRPGPGAKLFAVLERNQRAGVVRRVFRRGDHPPAVENRAPFLKPAHPLRGNRLLALLRWRTATRWRRRTRARSRRRGRTTTPTSSRRRSSNSEISRRSPGTRRRRHSTGARASTK